MPETAAQAGTGLDRRRFLARLCGLGVTAAVFPDTLLALAQKKGGLTEEAVAQAEKVAGLSFTEAQREHLLKGLNGLAEDFEKLRRTPPASTSGVRSWDEEHSRGGRVSRQRGMEKGGT